MENPEQPVGGLAVRAPAGVELRPLSRDDRDAAVWLARDAEGLPNPPATIDVGRFETLLSDADVVPYLAVQEGEPQGIGILRLRRRLNFATFEGWISVLHVRPAPGAEGILEALARALVAEWQLRQGHRLLVHVPTGNSALERAAMAVGMEEWMVDFRLAPIADGSVAPPAGVRIRPISVEDGEAVTRLIAEFGPQRSPVPDRMEAVLRTFAAHARAVAEGRADSAVAELEGTVVGICALEFRRPFWTDGTVAWIPDLVVTEPFRGRGIGGALLDSAIRTAADHGATEVVLESGPNRATAHRLYASRGFARTGRTWVLRRTDA